MILLFLSHIVSHVVSLYTHGTSYYIMVHVIKNSPALRNKSNKDESSNTDPSVRGLGSYDTRKFLELIGNQCPSYSVVTAKLRGEMRLVVLALKDLEEEITNVYTAGENTGIGGIMANKVRCCFINFLLSHYSCSLSLSPLSFSVCERREG